MFPAAAKSCVCRDLSAPYRGRSSPHLLQMDGVVPAQGAPGYHRTLLVYIIVARLPSYS